MFCSFLQISNFLLRWVLWAEQEPHFSFFYYIDLFKRGVFESIEHKFMVRGHSYLENDRDFALIKKRKKSSTVLLPEDWAKVIEGANLRNPFKVTKMRQEDFKSWKTHLDHKYCLQKKDTNGNPVRFQQIHRFNVGWGSELDPKTGQSVLTYHPEHVWIKTSHDPSQPWQKVAIKEKAASNSQPPALYSSPIPLKPAKVEDLKKIAEKHLPEPQRSFYLNLREEE